MFSRKALNLPLSGKAVKSAYLGNKSQFGRAVAASPLWVTFRNWLGDLLLGWFFIGEKSGSLPTLHTPTLG